MGIDVQTLILIIGISHLLQVLVLFNQFKANKNISGPGWWLMWSAAEVLGFALILLRSVPIFMPIVIIFQDIIIISGTIFIYIGIVQFFNNKVNWTFAGTFFVSFVVLHLFFFFIKDDIRFRTLIFDAYLPVIAFYTAGIIYKNRTGAISLTANFNIVIFLVHGIIFGVRAIMIILGTPVSEMFSQTLFNLLQYFDALIVGLLWTFGFIILLNQKLYAEISEVKEHFEKIFNTSPDAAVISRLSDGTFVDCNEGFTKISGYTKKEIFDKSSLDLNIWKNPSDRFEVVKMIEEKQFFENFEFPFQRKTGEVITGLMSGRILTIREIPHIISITRDISDRKIAEQLIKLKNEELLKLSAEKDKFYSIISHDLRGPFQNFLGLTEMMEEELPQLTMDELKNMVMSLKGSASNLFILLENLLSWSKMQQGLIPFNPQLHQLLSIVIESLRTVMDSAKTKRIDITFNIPDDIMVIADSNMLQIVFRNLVSNAVKFTPKDGKIHITSKTTIDKSLEISIKDSGIGINPSMIDNLFRLDIQTNRKGTDNEPSSGLGLLLCRDFIEKHCGKIWVESEEGKGSTFYFTLPDFR
jgi:PAS domain S-box-containing protein